MRSLTACSLAIASLLLVACGDAVVPTALSGVSQATMERGGGGDGGSKLPTCSGASDCAAGPVVGTGEDNTSTIAPTVIADNLNGLSSDGRGQ